MKNFDWSKFHDWVIGSITIDWGNGVMKMQLQHDIEKEIKATGFSQISVNRAFPWGKSCFINSMKCDMKDEQWLIEIELQSGDKISIKAANVEVI